MARSYQMTAMRICLMTVGALLVSCVALSIAQAAPTSQPATAPGDPVIKARVEELVANVKPLAPRYSDTVKNTIRITDIQIQGAQPQEIPLLRVLQKAQQEWLAVVLDVQTGKLKSGTPQFDDRLNIAAESVAKAEFARQQFRIDEIVGFQQRATDSLKAQSAVAKGSLQIALKDQVALEEEYNTLLRSVLNNVIAERAAEPRMAVLQKLITRDSKKIVYLREIDELEQTIAKGGAEKEISAAKKEIELDKQILLAMEAVATAEDKVEDLQAQKAALKK